MSNHGLFQQLSAQTLAIGTLNDNQSTGHEKIDANNTQLTALNTKLDSFSGHTNNTITLGDGSTQLRTVPLGYDRSNGKAVSFLVDAAGHQQVDAVDVTAKIDTLAGAGNNNIGEGSSKLQIYNYGRDVSAGNFKPMVVNSSAEQIVALSAVDNAVLDTIATNTANINVNVGDVEINVADLETLQTATNSKLDTIDAVLDTIKLDSAAIKTAVELIDNTVSGSELQVDIVASALPSGGATAANQTTLIGHVDGVEGKLDTLETTLTAIETDQAALEVLHTATNSKLDTIDNVLDTIKTDSAAIKTAVEILDNTVSGSEIQADIVSSALPSGASTSANQTTLIGHMDEVEGKLDTLETTLTAIETDQAALEVLHTATNSKLDTIDNVLDTIKTDSAAIKTAVEILDNTVSGSEIQADIVSSALPSGASTSANQTTLIGHMDEVEGKLDTLETTLTAIETDQAALEVLHTATNSKLDTIDSVLDTIKTDSAAIKTAVELLDNAVSGSELQVDVVSVPTTTVTGTVTANLSATDNAVLDDIAQKIGDVETAVQAIDDIVKAEDAAHSSGDKGVMFLGVRQDSQADFGADGDYVPLSIDADGKLRVAAAAASGGATEAKQDVLETTLTAIETDMAAIEVLITATNSKIDTFDAVLDASLVKQTNLETLITTLDGVQDNVLTKLGEVDAVLDNIKVDTEAIETAVEALNTRDLLATSLIIDGESISSGGGTHTTGSIEITKRPKGDGKLLFLIRVATVSPSDIAIRFLASGDNSNFFKLPLSFQTNENTDTGVGRVATLSFVPRYLKVELTNGNFSSASTCSVHMFS